MLSDEEKKAIKEVNHFKELTRYWQEEEYEEKEIAGYIETILNLIEKQSKEIEELKQNIHLKEVYVLKTNDYIKGTNIEDELCNKKWEDKIKAKILECRKILYSFEKELELKANKEKYIHKESMNCLLSQISILQSLLEKE